MIRGQSPSRPSERSSTERGVTLIEILLASSVLLIGASVFISSIIVSSDGVQMAGERARALLLAHEGLEVARTMRDKEFSQLTDGTRGLAISNNQWMFNGASDTTDRFTRSVRISPIDEHTKEIESRVSWQDARGSKKNVALVSRLTQWRATTKTDAESIVLSVSNASLSGDNKKVQNIGLYNSHASAVTITHITPSWTNKAKIEYIEIENELVWSKNGPGLPSGKQSSAVELDIQDFVLEPQTTSTIESIKFDHRMVDAQITLAFTMQDTSTTTATVSF